VSSSRAQLGIGACKTQHVCLAVERNQYSRPQETSNARLAEYAKNKYFRDTHEKYADFVDNFCLNVEREGRFVLQNSLSIFQTNN